MKKYFIITYGCQMNLSDSERIATVLEDAGYSPASNINETDLIIINICSVRQSAIDRVYGKIKNFAKLKMKNEKLKIILTGCILKSDIEKLKNKIDYILPIKNLKSWPRFLKEKSYFFYPNPREIRFNKKSNIDYLKINPKYQNNFSTYVPIMTGCDKFCSYCVVPYTRGPEFSRPAEDILNEVKTLIEQGCKEIWLLGQNVNSYHSRICTNMTTSITNKYSRKFVPKLVNIREVNFGKLLTMINNIPGNFWIRFTSPHPKDFSDETIEAMAKCEKVTPYLNLPIQSGDDEILKKMNRPYTINHYRNLVKKIRNVFKKYRKDLEKNIFLSTDVIVGFPEETKKQFKNTAKLFREIKFDMAYISQYSPRPETTAAKMEDNVSHQEKARREKVLTEILKETAQSNNEKFIGKEIYVLIEKSKNNFLIGKSRHYKTLKIERLEPNIQNPASNLIGKFVEVKIINATSFGLKGKLVE